MVQLLGLLISEVDDEKVGLCWDLKVARVFANLMPEGREFHDSAAK